MIPTQKTINIELKSDFTIPMEWKRKLNINEGITVILKVEDHKVFIKKSWSHTHEVVSTVGRKETIYIPKEIRDNFKRKEINQFQIYIDEREQAIILIPS